MEAGKFRIGDVLYCSSGVRECPIRVTFKDVIRVEGKDGSVRFVYNTSLTYRVFEEKDLFRTKKEYLESLEDSQM